MRAAREPRVLVVPKPPPPSYQDYIKQDAGSSRSSVRVSSGLSVAPGVSERSRVASLERENRALMANQGKLIQETNKRIQSQMEEVRLLKEENGRLAGENVELRDLCVYLDDDRQKTKKLSREWQRFGRYTSGVMKEEVEAYRAKLSELERRQETLVKENCEMKQLAIFLDDQRSKMHCTKCGGAVAEGPTPPGLLSLLETPKGRPKVSPPLSPQDIQFLYLEESGEEAKSPGGSEAPSQTSEIGTSFSDSSADHRDALTRDSNVLEYISALERRVEQLETATMATSSPSVSSEQITIRLRPNTTPLIASTDKRRVEQLETATMATSSPSVSSEQITIRLRPNTTPLIASTDSAQSMGASTVYGSESEGGVTGDEYPDMDERLAEDEGFPPSEDSPSPANSTLTPIEEEGSDVLDSSDDDVPVTSPARKPRSSSRLCAALEEGSGQRCSSEPTGLNLAGLEAGPVRARSEWGPLVRTASVGLDEEDPFSQDSWASVGSQSTSLSEALKVLEVQERTAAAASSRTEKAIIHQMCKVVWKTLDEETTSRRTSTFEDERSFL